MKTNDGKKYNINDTIQYFNCQMGFKMLNLLFYHFLNNC